MSSLIRRIRNAESTDSCSPILVNSLPKSGTHLLNKLLDSLGYSFSGNSFSSTSIFGQYALIKSLTRGAWFGQPSIDVGLDIPVTVRKSWIMRSFTSIKSGQYCGGHLPFTDATLSLLLETGIKMLHIIRDPRDVLLSWAHYVPKTKWHYGRKGLEGLDIEDRVIKILQGYESGCFFVESFAHILKRSNGWLEKNCAKVVRFEDLVGEKGGGNMEQQIQSIQSIAQFVGADPTNIEHIATNLFGGTKVFRKGQIGAWRDELSIALIDKIHENIAQHISEMGYHI